MTIRIAALAPSQGQRRKNLQISVLCIGPLLIDRLLFEADGKEDLYPGGNAVITGAVLARQGINTRVLGQVGADSHGEEIRGVLQRHRVDTSCLRLVTGARTKVATVGIRADGTWYRKSADPDIFPYLASRGVLDIPSGFTHLHVGGLNALLRAAPEPTLRLLRQARKAKCSISIGLASSRCDLDLLRHALAPTDFLLGTLDEFSHLLAEEFPSSRELMRALERAPWKNCVVTLGAQGVLVKWQGSVRAIESMPTVEARNTLGAGDVFAGVLIAARLRMRSLAESLKRAVRAARRSVLQPRWDDALTTR